MIKYDSRAYSDIFLIGDYAPLAHDQVNFLLDKALIDITGDSYLSGKYPEGITSVGSVPTIADITVTIRARHGSLLDNVVVSATTSAQDGTWLVSNLSKYIRFNVIARKNGYKDVIVSDVAPF